MINIITFGDATKTIGLNMKNAQTEVFNLYQIDDYIKKCDSHVEYEKESTKCNLGLTNDENLFILNPSSMVSGALLAQLELTQRRDNIIVCILSDFDFLSRTQIDQTKFVVNVLQEMARSGAIKELILIDQKYIEKYVVNLTISDYYQKIDEYISNILSMCLWCQDVKGIINNSVEKIETTRITTLGFYDLDENEIHLFFDLTYSDKSVTFPLEIDFYFTLKKETIQNEPELMNKIKQSIKNKKQNEFPGASIGFKILEGFEDYTLTQIRTSKLQTV